MLRTTITMLLLAGASSVGTAQPCNWGSFDASRTNYANAPLTGSVHTVFAGIINTAGGTVVSPTPVLTPGYLSGVDVFFTSLLDSTNGHLSAAEQSALKAWVAGGGTLIVTADYINISATDTFTQSYGIGYTNQQANVAAATTVGAHSQIAGVNVIDYAATVSINHGPDAQVLAIDENGLDFLIVMEPATGFVGGGRVVIWGDHSTLVNGLIGNADNAAFAINLVKWACSPIGPICPNDSASWSNYGAGWPGTFGVPTLTASSNPVVGDSVTVDVQNSLGATTTGFLLLGIAAANTPTALGGTILVAASTIPSILIPTAGVSLTGTIPPDPILCGVPVYLQVLTVDSGGSAGASFTPGLRLDLGS